MEKGLQFMHQLIVMQVGLQPYLIGIIQTLHLINNNQRVDMQLQVRTRAKVEEEMFQALKSVANLLQMFCKIARIPLGTTSSEKLLVKVPSVKLRKEHIFSQVKK